MRDEQSMSNAASRTSVALQGSINYLKQMHVLYTIKPFSCFKILCKNTTPFRGVNRQLHPHDHVPSRKKLALGCWISHERESVKHLERSRVNASTATLGRSLDLRLLTTFSGSETVRATDCTPIQLCVQATTLRCMPGTYETNDSFFTPAFSVVHFPWLSITRLVMS